MSGTSLLIVGFSFVTLNGCEYIPVFGIRPLIRVCNVQGLHQPPLVS